MNGGYMYLFSPTHIHVHIHIFRLPWWLSGKESSCNAGASGDTVSILGSGRSPGRGQGYPLWYSCLKNPMDRGAWWATLHKITKSWAQLSIHRFRSNVTKQVSFLRTERKWNWSRSVVTPWTVAYEVPLSMGFSRQEYWSGLSFPSPGDLPNPGVEPRSLML